MMIRGRVSRQVVDALREGPKTLGELAAIVYGSDEAYNREAARMVIFGLRRNKNPVHSEWLYIYRHGTPRSERVMDVAWQVLDGIRSRPQSAAELAKAIHQNDERHAMKSVYETIGRLRKNHGVKIDTEMRYSWKGK